ncbi:hypothetical protein [Sphingopyxis witflariensis]|uniref:hypothetical protein n=1 Tax=Sphingopyxis witflariensis TaxID=173675 RepID=UPI00118191A2|nr:hypothetical protein [Sphingopyxis witflariensis]
MTALDLNRKRDGEGFDVPYKLFGAGVTPREGALMSIDWTWLPNAGAWLADNVDRYQNILAGALAIVAARIAVKPVWAQVIATNTQTQIAHLETLQKLLGEALQRSDKVQDDFIKPQREMNQALYDFNGESEKIDGQTAHHLGRQISNVLGWYLVTLAGTESGKVEEAKSALKAALDELERTLAMIEWVDFNDQYGDDHAYDDVEWAEILANAEAASKEASAKGSAVFKAYYALRSVQADSIKHLRTQIRNIEHALAKLS